MSTQTRQILDPSNVRYIIVHCSATPRGRNVNAAQIRSWHLKRGFADIGYHYVILLDGTIEAGRALSRHGAHCKGKNACSIGVCYVGGVEVDGKTPADTRTPQQKSALNRLIARLLEVFPHAEVRGHRDFAPKACPSFDATSEYRSLRHVAPFLLGAFTLASCQSTRHTRLAETNYCAETSTDNLVGNTLLTLSDSTDIIIPRPEITIVQSDSSRVTIRGENLTLKRRKNTAAANTVRYTSRDTAVCTRSQTILSDSRTEAPVTSSFVASILLASVAFTLFSLAWRRLTRSRS